EPQMPAFAMGRQGLHPAAEVIDGMKGFRLRLELADQVGGVDGRISRDVIDRLFRIERGALTPRHVEGVHDMAFHLQHAAFDHGKEPHRSRADDADIRLVSGRFRHSHPRSLAGVTWRPRASYASRAMQGGGYMAASYMDKLRKGALGRRLLTPL